MRQDILETVMTTSSGVDGVLAELENERAHLTEISTALQGRRDRAVSLTNMANLITGTGVGIAVIAHELGKDGRLPVLHPLQRLTSGDISQFRFN
jgi:hypothetical protein